MHFLLKWLETRRLLVIAYLLCWPPLLILATRRSYQTDVLGWWSYRVFMIVVAGAAAMAVLTLAVTMCCRSDACLRWLERCVAAVRRIWLVSVAAVMLPIAGWLGVVVYLELIFVRPNLLILVVLTDLAFLMLVWTAALVFVGREASERRELLKKSMLSAAAFVITIVAVDVAGNALGLAPFANWDLNPKDLLTEFRTDDFHVTIVTNTQGLREVSNVDFERTEAARVIVVGDSMTFGWGVENHEAFPKVAESRLRNHFGLRNAEVVNMGKPGAAPNDYLHFIWQYAAPLKPDVIVVGFLIGNDCPVAPPPHLTGDEAVQRELAAHVADADVNYSEQLLMKSYFLRVLYSGLLPRLRNVQTAESAGKRGPIFGEPNPLDPTTLAADIARLDDSTEAQQRYERLRTMGLVDKGLNWHINPWLIRSMVLHPAGPADSLVLRDESKKEMQYEWKLCEGLLLEMKSAAKDCGAELIVFAIPHAHAASEDWIEFLRECGCQVSVEMTTTRTVNNWLKSFCERKSIVCVDATEQIRKRQSAGAQLYWKTDDHMTPEGQGLLGKILADALHDQLSHVSRVELKLDGEEDEE